MLPHPSISQPISNDYLYGFVVTTDNDTIKGKVAIGMDRVKVRVSGSKKPKKFYSKQIYLVKHGKYLYENIKHRLYRIVINGPVRYYFKQENIKEQGFNAENTYYCVKRPDESDVTFVYVKREKCGAPRPRMNSSLASYASSFVLGSATSRLVDLKATGKLPSGIQRDKIQSYFSDCAVIEADIKNGKFSNFNTLRNLVTKYNRLTQSNECGD